MPSKDAAAAPVIASMARLPMARPGMASHPPRLAAFRICCCFLRKGHYGGRAGEIVSLPTMDACPGYRVVEETGPAPRSGQSDARTRRVIMPKTAAGGRVRANRTGPACRARSGRLVAAAASPLTPGAGAASQEPGASQWRGAPLLERGRARPGQAGRRPVSCGRPQPPRRGRRPARPHRRRSRPGRMPRAPVSPLPPLSFPVRGLLQAQTPSAPCSPPEPATPFRSQPVPRSRTPHGF